MCRLFGMSAGDQRVHATFWLLGAPDSLRMQSRMNADGTGLGFFDEAGLPQVDKMPIAASADQAFASDARLVCSRTFVAHVRHATNGPLTSANTHPFSMDGRLFPHNGVLGDMPKLERRLGDELRRVGGETDSERFFALITSQIDSHGGDVAAGIRAAVRWVVDELPVVSINFVLATATDLWALRFPATDTLFVLERPAGGASTGQAGTAPLAQSGSHGTRVESAAGHSRPLVVVASERMDDEPGWREIRSGELIHVGPSLEVTSELVLDEVPASP
jgi:predicted glutamine amidotransferase